MKRLRAAGVYRRGGRLRLAEEQLALCRGSLGEAARRVPAEACHGTSLAALAMLEAPWHDSCPALGPFLQLECEFPEPTSHSKHESLNVRGLQSHLCILATGSCLIEVMAQK